ncbi:MAG: hypothetical protein Q9216_001604 [Gyalolechia sp. 2 TL-2023]
MGHQDSFSVKLAFFLFLGVLSIHLASIRKSDPNKFDLPYASSSVGKDLTGRFKRSSCLPNGKCVEVASGTELRILPLGDSITYGYQPRDDGNHGNGYRLQLQNALSGSKFLFVGSVRSGSMVNNFNEGHPGATIKAIEGFADLSLDQKPNIVLIHAGTNDLNADSPDDPYASAPDRLDSLISKVISVYPDATILVAQIIHAGDSSSDDRIQTFNARVPGVVAAQAAKGHKNIAVVDFSSVTASDLIDKLHPTNGGYIKMGNIWFSAIQRAASSSWIKKPVGADPSGAEAAAGRIECLSGLFCYPAQNGAEIANGLDHGCDGKFTPSWAPQGQVQLVGGIGHNPAGVELADLDNDGIASYSSNTFSTSDIALAVTQADLFLQRQSRLSLDRP